MNKELDPLREIEAAEEREELPPTTEIGGAARAAASERVAPQPEARKPSPSSSSSSSSSGPSSRLPAVQTYSSHTSTRMRYGTQHQVSIRENIAPREHVRLYGNLGPIFTLFVLGLIVSFLAIGIIKSVTTVPPPKPVQNEYDPRVVTLPDPSGSEAYSFFEPLFGQYAVKKCAERCETRSGAMRDGCVRGCAMYNLHIYGRRVSFDRYDPNSDVEEITDRCMKREVQLEQHTSGSAWLQEIGAALSVLQTTPDTFRSQDIAKIRAQYHRLLESSQRLRLPPGGTSMELSLSKDLSRAVCLQANVALTQIALSHVQQAGDEVSDRYYRRIVDGLESRANEVSSRVLSTSKSMKLW